MKRKLLAIVLLSLFSSLCALASPETLTYQGRILKSDGQPLEFNNVSFLFEITSDDGSCTIYREQRDGVNMQNSKGVFDVAIGLGTRIFPDAGTNPSFKLPDAFVNGVNHSCYGSGSWLAAIDSIRQLKVQFHDGVGWQVVSPSNVIRSVPFAMSAHSASQLGDKKLNDFVLKENAPGAACTAGQVITWDGVNFSCVTDAGGSGVITSITGNAPISVSGGAAATVSIAVGTAAGTVAAGNDARIAGAFQASTSLAGDLSGALPNPTVAAIQGKSVSSVAPVDNQVLKYNFGASQWQPVNFGVDDLVSSSGLAQFGSANCTVNQTLTWSSLTDTFLCQSIQISESQITGSIPDSKLSIITSAGKVANSATSATASSVANTIVLRDGSGNFAANAVSLSAVVIRNAGAQSISLLTPASLTPYSLTLPSSAGVSGQYLQTDGAGVLSWSTPNAAGITSLGGLTAGTQSFAIGTGGTAPFFSSATSTHTLNIPMASTSSVTAGLISKADYDAFNTKLGASSVFSGDVSGTSSAMSVDKIKAKSVVPVAYSAGQVLRYDGTNWVNANISLATDIGGTLPVANGGTGASTVAAARTNLGLGTAATNDTGAVSGNIPLIGTTGIAANKMCTSDGTSSLICNTNIPAGSQWTTTGSDIYYDSGNVGIGTTTPTEKLDIYASANVTQGIKIENQSAGTGNYSHLTLRNGTTGGFFFRLNGSGFTPISFNETNTAVISAQSGLAGLNIATSGSTSPIKFFTNSTEVMRLSGNGNVGIGTTSPGFVSGANRTLTISTTASEGYGALEIRGQANLTNTQSVINFINRSTVPSDVNTARIEVRNFGSNTTKGALAFYTKDGSLTEKMTIQPDGKVGIGTAAPTATLEVAGQIVAKENVVASGATINFALGNVQTLSAPGTATLTLQNMVNGGHYTVVIDDTTSRTYDFSSCGTVRAKPTLAATSGRSIYSILKTAAACYITWQDGY